VPLPHPQPAAPITGLTVLVADDDADCRSVMEGAVRSLGYSCSTARDGVEAWEMYEANRADVILSDWQMPRMDGWTLCRRVRADDSHGAYTHFIFVTGNRDKAHFLDGMRAGADDYLAKPVDLDQLEARLVAAQRVITVHRNFTEHDAELRGDREEARAAARTDPLTAAFGRQALEENLESLAARAARYGHRYCAALCDVDRFKSYNDHFGHLPGDEVLRRIARTIHDALRGGDVFYRYGGAEFLLILPEQSRTEAARGMDRVRQEVERLAIPHAPTAGLPVVTISVGISAYCAQPTESIDGWLRRADAALCAAKARGRNGVAVDDGEDP
jgi:two-component system cell cycle response regulator